ncbi:spore germination protein [Peribacillus loiseleuriae]|uniref:Spore gernimation protein GerA n=1 Tax=Peribacillus loiseleuriae TaxID=1679170 RepID=A0A0K9GWQ2_9BACI|nr:spore germination protein [Peribacillus loiseleuriae]KMY50697.1 spore gernimation protein GerA [Peribacillus loiseleuriae]
MKSWFQNKRAQGDTKQENWIQTLAKSEDLKQTFYNNQKTNIRFSLTFLTTLVDEKIIEQSILTSLLDNDFHSIDDLKRIVPIGDIQTCNDPSKIEENLCNGYVLVTIETEEQYFGFIAAKKEIGRGITSPEVEISVIGPKEAFVESIATNLNLIRRRLPVKELIIEEFTIGSLSKTKIAFLHMEGITNQENVNTVRQRLKDVEFDAVTDSSYIVQIISDNSNSPFPQLLDTERPDRVAAVLAEGMIAICVDGSPQVLLTPTTLVDFFSSFEDYYLNWIIASFFRLLRVSAVTFSIMVTPLYVAVLTYHYEIIPHDLLSTLITSRRIVPLPPVLEAIILELTIELLREAGARLPTKVGQTIGIVGGIVIGTASVEAGLTSNVLLILVALAALASFTTPIYKMSNTIRLLRFPFLFFAYLWGLVGIVFCLCILLTHLIRLTSLGRPFLEPFYPTRWTDLQDSLIRFPFKERAMRPQYLRTEKPYRYSKKKASIKKDIDE